MNTRGDITDTYDEALRLIREQLTRADDTLRCPKCDFQQFDWIVTEGEDLHSLYSECEYCGRTDWMYFEEDVPWPDS